VRTASRTLGIATPRHRNHAIDDWAGPCNTAERGSSVPFFRLVYACDCSAPRRGLFARFSVGYFGCFPYPECSTWMEWFPYVAVRG
jgi:hypothetical protein